MTDNSNIPASNRSSRSGGFLQRLLNVAPTDLMRLVFLSIVVGLVLAAFRVDPKELWVDFFGTLANVWGGMIEFVTHSAGDLLNYFLLGAIIVVPIWLLLRVLNAANRN
jgi:hypothetical protein